MNETLAWLSLKTAIIQACKARGDDEAHRAALLDELRQRPSSEWAEWQTYFEQQAGAGRWEAR